MAWGGPEPVGPSGMELPRSWHQTLISRDPVPSEASEERAAGKIQLELAGLPAWPLKKGLPRAGGCWGHGVPAPGSRQPRAWLLGSPGTPERAGPWPGGPQPSVPARGPPSGALASSHQRRLQPALDPGLLGAGSSTGRGRPAQTWARPGTLRPEATGDTPAVAPLPRTGAGGPCPGGRPSQTLGSRAAATPLYPSSRAHRLKVSDLPPSCPVPDSGPRRPLVSIKHFCVLKRIPGLFFFAFIFLFLFFLFFSFSLLKRFSSPGQFGSVDRVSACGLRGPGLILIKGTYLDGRLEPQPQSGHAGGNRSMCLSHRRFSPPPCTL
uniref:Uncharacterized protein n=1 Tax=Myotis myotis TaxID=51298 RepID=A0A7J7UDB5_MYOMY|nr:hypothetical protein mMyoMyo1_008800 [Myotis myotis]